MNETVKSLLSAFLVVGMLSAIGCSKSSELGLSLVEQEQTDIRSTDTVSLVLSTVRTDKSETHQRTQLVVGAYTDPIFGQVESAAYMNFRLTRTNATFDGAVLDSIVLSLAYESFGHYGDIYSANPGVQTWDVLKMTEPILDQIYESDASFMTSDVLKSGFTFVPNYQDSLYIGTDSAYAQPHIRIKLDDAGGLALVEDFLRPADPNVYNSNIDFKNWFNGIKVVPTSGAQNSSIIRLKFKNSQTKISVYYTDTTGGGSVPNVFEFLTDEDAESVSSFSHDYAGTDVLNTTTTDTIVYMQGLDGVATKIEFPNIQDLGNVIVNKAELIVMVQDTGTTEYPEPFQVIAKTLNTANEWVLIDDVITSLLNTNPPDYSLFGGELERDNATSEYFYRFHLAQIMQDMIEGNMTENAVYITPSSPLNPERIKLVNHRSDYAKAKLFLTYTKLK